jgi:aspartyl-tRNA(Asn)/glutamyl-tRNA(Gln) amidotransferase subunit A
MVPTYGRVSRQGLVAYGSSLEQVGPLARSVADCALLLEVIAGYDEKDAVSLPTSVPAWRTSLVDRRSERLVGIVDELWNLADSPTCQAAHQAVLDLEAAGVRVERISLPLLAQAIGCYTVIACAEATANLARFDGIHLGKGAQEANRYILHTRRSRHLGFGDEVKRRLLIGSLALRHDAWGSYETAKKVRATFRKKIAEVMSAFDALIWPTAPCAAWLRQAAGGQQRDTAVELASDRLTVLANLIGAPAISVPCGTDASGLPLGIQLLGRPLEEGVVLQLAAVIEASRAAVQAFPPSRS